MIKLFGTEIMKPVPPPFRVSTELRLWTDPWKIKKRITDSDRNSSCRLMLPRTEVMEHVISVMSEEMISVVKNIKIKGGLSVNVVDHDTGFVHIMGFKHWPSSNSYVLNRSWSQFVKSRDLNINDEIGLFWDPYHCQFHIRIL